MASHQGSSIDPYGFERPDDFDHKTYNEFVANYLKILAHRKMKWTRLRPTKKLKHSAKVKRYVRKGIPDENRRVVWLAVSGAQKLWDQYPNLYRKLLTGKIDEQAVDVIKTDIPRTFPNNIYFQQPHEGFLNPLFNVLVAFVNYHSEIGYCQGLNYVAGLLLLVVKDEEVAFWLLTTLIRKILPDYYSTGMKGLLMDINVLEELVLTREPKLHQHMVDISLSFPLLCTKWFICLFIDVLPIETVLRIWDCIFYEGNKTILRVALTVILMNADALLTCTDLRDAVTCMNNFTQSAATTKCHDFMQMVFKVSGKLTSRKLALLRDKHFTLLH